MPLLDVFFQDSSSNTERNPYYGICRDSSYGLVALFGEKGVFTEITFSGVQATATTYSLECLKYWIDSKSPVQIDVNLLKKAYNELAQAELDLSLDVKTLDDFEDWRDCHQKASQQATGSHSFGSKSTEKNVIYVQPKSTFGIITSFGEASKKGFDKPNGSSTQILKYASYIEKPEVEAFPLEIK